MKITKHIILASTALCCALTYSPIATAQQQGKITNQEYDTLARKMIDAEAKCKGGEPGSHAAYLETRKAFENRLPLNSNTFSSRRLEELKAINPNKNISQDLEEEQAGYYRRRFDRQFPLLAKCPPTAPIYEDAGTDLTKTPYGILFGFGAGYAEIKPPQAGYGVAIVPGAEKFIAKTSNKLDGYTIGGRVNPNNGRYGFGLQYTDVNGSSEGQIANGAENVGIVYNDRAPNGSTGVAIGPRGMDVRTETLSSRLRLQIDMSSETDGGVSFGGRLRLGGGAEFSDTNHRAWVTTPSFNDISSRSEQDIDEAFFFVNAQTEVPLNKGDGAITIMLVPMLEAGYRHAKLASRQFNICGLCAAPERDFAINIEDENSGFYYDAALEARFGAKISERATIGLSANIGYRSHAAEIINPETGDDLFIRNNPTHLETDSETTAGLTAWFSAEF